MCAGMKAGRALQQSPFAISVLDVEPYDIVRHVILIKASIDSLDISLVTVVPAALMVPNGEVLRQGCSPCQSGILGRDLHGNGDVASSVWKINTTLTLTLELVVSHVFCRHVCRVMFFPR